MFVYAYLDTFLKNYPGKEVNKLFRKPMKMRNLEAWGVPSYIVDILEKNYSSCLLPVQEKAVREYGVLDFDRRNKEGRMQYAPTGGIDSRFRGCVVTNYI